MPGSQGRNVYGDGGVAGQMPPRLTFLQRQKSDGCAEPPTAQAHQMGFVRLHFQPFACFDQVQGSSLQVVEVADKHPGRHLTTLVPVLTPALAPAPALSKGL